MSISSSPMNNEAEIRIPASAVSRGIGVGRAICLYGRKRQYFRIVLAESQLERETRRFRAAVRLATRQLGTLAPNGTSDNAAGILDFHRLLLADPVLLRSIEDKIRMEKINAEWAVKLVTDEMIAKYKAITDERLRERHIDVDDVAERVLKALGGGRRAQMRLEPGTVIVSREMNPSTLIELSESHPAALVTEHGGWTSHTYILAREMGLPSVTGIKKVLSRIRSGDKVMVDGFRGEVIIGPGQHTVDVRSCRGAVVASNGPRKASELKTLDGRHVIIRANSDISGGYEKAKAQGARGIGLYRSEFLFNQFRGIPPELEQFEAYKKIADLVGDDGVRIRTFDLGDDDIDDRSSAKFRNPALGLRGIRLSLSRQNEFRIQLRALLQAAHGRELDIILPMISDVAEIIRTKEVLSEEKADLEQNGIETGEPGVGAMIEVPAAVFLIDEIAAEVDFLCLGTNDLVQYLLAVDRDNESVSSWFNTLNPAVLKAIRIVLAAAENRRIPCIVCGEMAGSPFYVPVLIGLGATELSMNAASIERTRRVVSGIAFEEALELSARIDKCRTSSEAEDLVRDAIRTRWSHLFGDEADGGRS